MRRHRRIQPRLSRAGRRWWRRSTHSACSTRRDGIIRHFWSGEMGSGSADPGQDPRGAPDLMPIWTILDSVPEGRGTDWYPKLDYGAVNFHISDWRSGRDYSALRASPPPGPPGGRYPRFVYTQQHSGRGRREFTCKPRGGEGGIDSGHPGPRPSGAVAQALRRPAPPLSAATLVETFGSNPALLQAKNKKGPDGPFLFSYWRRGRDSNPRWAFDPYALSRGAPSTTRPPLRTGPCLFAERGMIPAWSSPGKAKGV